MHGEIDEEDEGKRSYQASATVCAETRQHFRCMELFTDKENMR